jgi:alkylhydroperoxidase family enzyme
LRVAAINGAAFEWIHHEVVGRQLGLTNAQLFVIRDTTAPLPPSRGVLNPLQTAALAFSDASTRHVSVPTHVTEILREELKTLVLLAAKATMVDEGEVKKKVDDLFVECALVVASYNMVSRFLVAVDVAGSTDEDVPWPVVRTEVSWLMVFYV